MQQNNSFYSKSPVLADGNCPDTKRFVGGSKRPAAKGRASFRREIIERATSSFMAAATPAYDPNMLVEQYLRQQCEQQVAKLQAHAQEKIKKFRMDAERVKKELSRLLEMPSEEDKFKTT
jgi:hypothetical protein